MTFTIQQILTETRLGRMQTVGHMQVIPVLGEEDETFSPPKISAVKMNAAGHIQVRNQSNLPTIVPHGMWIGKSIPNGTLLTGRGRKTITNLMTLANVPKEEAFSPKEKGEKEEEIKILPAELRPSSLTSSGMFQDSSQAQMKERLRLFNESYGVTDGQHISYFLKQFEKELDEFVAEFEIVPQQLGAIVLVMGKVVGVERAPSYAFWNTMWKPLIRVCYGSLAMKAKKIGAPIPARVPLVVNKTSLTGISKALAHAAEQEAKNINKTLEESIKQDLHHGNTPDETIDQIQLTTVASERLAGQVVTVSGRADGSKKIKFASLSATKM